MEQDVCVWLGEISNGEEHGTSLSEVLEPLVTAVEHVALRLGEISRKLDSLKGLQRRLDDIRFASGGL